MGFGDFIKKAVKTVAPIASSVVGSPALGAAVAGGLELLGGREGNIASAREASKSRDFTKEQLQNRHQWEVQDLKKAGLNPVLSAQGVPSIGGSAAAAQQNPIGNAVSSALSAARAKKELKLLDAQVRNVYADSQQKASQSYMYDEYGKKASWEKSMLAPNLRRAAWEDEFYRKNPRMFALEKAGKYASGVINSAKSATSSIHDLGGSAKKFSYKKGHNK